MTKDVRYLFVLAIAMMGAANVAAQDDLPSGAVVLDDNLGMHSWPYPSVSPGGQWVAYVSQGYVCVCNVENPKPRSIMEVPNSWTWPHFKVVKSGRSEEGAYNDLSYGLKRDDRRKLLEQVTHTIYGLNWTYDSSGFVFGIEQYVAKRKSWIKDTYLANVDGALTPLAHVDPDTPTSGGVAGILTRDRKYLVASYQGPLLWDVNRNKPRATPFLTLIPSSTSDRWLGIEKDTRQLVVVDNEFKVIQRFKEFLPEKTHDLAMKWSPDERFIISRNRIGFDHFSNWEGFRLDLQTGEKRLMDGRIMNEKFGFTGHGGEFYRCGNHAEKTRGYDKMVGSHLILVPDGVSDAVELWKMESDNEPAMGSLVTWGGITPIQMSSDGELFILSLRKWINQKYYSYYELIDRRGNRWHLRDENGDQLLAPYLIVGFADENRLLVAYDDERMFTFPVAVVKTANNKVN